MLQLPSLIQVAASRDDLYVFRITGEVSADDMTELAAAMTALNPAPRSAGKR